MVRSADNFGALGALIWLDRRCGQTIGKKFCWIRRLAKKVWLGIVRVHVFGKNWRTDNSGGVFMFGGFGVNMEFYVLKLL